MITFFIIVGILVWWVSGIASFIYWWTKDFDFETIGIIPALFIGLIVGPFAFFIGWTIHGDSHLKKPKTLISKRK